ncbi:putative L-type lectin-domain containing receptor kinase-like protein [Trifolium pratense]|uniref:Putative L-type lectin-domain containing receptor kinase-like protein n=1 Tax=Trifolium pratense TaxID=57577 RepID=A0A2K3JUP3_TRIPR|nr:putative L-type lectin-domain containing receptor kinase-like protein [Trifolium pratense]
MKVTSHVGHPNLLHIRGRCQDNNEIITVYDFVPNGSLDKWLFGAGVLPWTLQANQLAMQACRQGKAGQAWHARAHLQASRHGLAQAAATFLKHKLTNPNSVGSKSSKM